MQDSLGNRMKEAEGIESDRRFLPTLPVMARLDGRCFSSFTQDMERPYDKRMSDLMIHTTRKLVEETNALCGYTQSDEITLVWHEPDRRNQIFFDGKIQKMCSILAAMCSVYFNHFISAFFDNDYSLSRKFPTFDCRVWMSPSRIEATNCFLWREWDATKNSISMAASHYYSHQELMNKNSKEKQELLFQKGVNWNDYPVFFRRGSYIQRVKNIRKYNTEELEKLPLRHEARTNPDLTVERSEVRCIDMPILSTVVNREDVIFDGENPILEGEDPLMSEIKDARRKLADFISRKNYHSEDTEFGVLTVEDEEDGEKK